MTALPLCLFFGAMDLTYFLSCLQKFTSGGWFALGSAFLIMLVMVAWWDGWKRLVRKGNDYDGPQREVHGDGRHREQLIRLPGTGVFLSNFHKEVPPMLLQYVTQTARSPGKVGDPFRPHHRRP